MKIDPRFTAKSRYSDADLLAAIETAAIMVQELGEPALPFFERLEQEFHRRAGIRDAMSRAAAILQDGKVTMLR